MAILAALALIATAQTANSFQGKDLISGKEISFPNKSAKRSVLVFFSAKCPCSASHEKSVADLAREYGSKGVEFIGIHANQNEPMDLAKTHFRQAALPFPVVQDQGAGIANELKALKTPHVFVLEKGKVVFQGGVDDSADASHAKKLFLKTALQELDQGKPVTVAQARSLGCVIQR